ncbi:MAG: hypothetical protein ABSF83_02245 [Nitrososphaerales archaeon]|jgi:hypothetical protein
MTVTLKRSIDALVCASVALGAVFIYAAVPLVPAWLLAAIAVGEVAYALTAVALVRGDGRAYYAVVALAVLVLAVSLPQPGHYAFAANGRLGPFLIFTAGSALQACLLVAVPLYLRRRRAT